jgi:hypothetical protein
MATDSDTKLTRYTSAVTVVTAEVMNALYGGEYGYNTTADEYDPVVYGHVHDGGHVDGHASKVYLTNGEHVRGQLAHKNLGGYDGTTPAVQVDNIQCYPDNIHNKPSEHTEQLTIPEYTESGGVRCYYLDLSMTIGGEDTHVQYNKDGEFGGDSGFVYDHENGRVGIGTDDPHKLLHLEKIDTYPVIQLSRKESNLDENQSLGRIQFGGTTDDGVTYDWNSSMIRARTSEVWDTAANTSGSRLEFYTTPNGSHINSIKVTIDGDGFVGIGAQTPTGTELLYVEGDAYINGKLTVTGLIDPTGLVLTPEDPVNVTVGDGEGAFFVSDGTSPAVNAGHPYFKDSSGSVIDLSDPVIDLALNDLNDVDTTSVQPGDTILYSAGQGWATGSPGGSPGGSDTSVQFNDSGSFNGNDGFLYNKDDGTGGSHPTITLSNRSPSDADSGRMTEVAFEGFLAGAASATLMAQLQVSHSGSGADSKAQADLHINDGTGPQHVIRVAHNGYTGIGAVGAGEPVRRLHIKDSNDDPPLRINNLTKKTGHVMVWEDATGDVFYDDTITNNVQPKKSDWPSAAPYDISIEESDHGNLVVIGGQNNNDGKVLLPYAPGNPTEWWTGANFWIKNMSNGSNGEPGSIALKPEGSTEIDGSTDDLTIENGASYHLTCFKGSEGQPNEWFIISCCGASPAQGEAANNAGVPDIQMSIQDGAYVVNDGDNVTVSETVTVDGSGSSDTDGDVLQKIWTWSIGDVVQGPVGDVDTFTIGTAELIDSVVVVKLKVNDGSIDSAEISKTFNVVAANQQPIAAVAISIAGNGEVGDLITADDTGTNDPDGDSLTYVWTFSEVPGESSITDDNALNPAGDASSQTWTPDVAGAYTISLTVTDEHGYASTPASAEITVAAANLAPTVSIDGTSGTLETGESITMVATASDADGSIAIYAWTVTTQPGDTASFVNAAIEDAVFTAGTAGDYTLRLTVTDNDGETAWDEHDFTLAAANQQPIAFLTASFAGNVGETGVLVTADGTGSSDPDGDSFTYAWTFGAGLPDGSSITDDNALNPASDASIQTFTPDVAGLYTIYLTVTDVHGYASAEASASLLAAAANQQPAAVISGLPDGPETGSEITVSGVTSSDPDGDSITWDWTMDSVPDGSSVPTESLGTASTAAFTPDVAGTYTIGLVVTDQHGLASDKVTAGIAVTAANQQPTAVIDDITASPEADSAVNASGTSSSDPEGDDIAYAWTMDSVPDGSSVETGSLGSDTSATFTPDIEGHYIIGLIVTDEHDFASNKVTADITVAAASNEAPTASFKFTDLEGVVEKIYIGVSQQLRIDASDSSDNDGSIVSYEFTKLDGFGGNVIGQWTLASSAIATTAQEGPGYDYWRVRVSDNDGAWSAPVEKRLPVVANPVTVAVENDKFVLNGNTDQAPTMHGGVPYLFDQTHASLAEGSHKLLFTRNSGAPNEYYCTFIGSPGVDGYLLFEPPLDPQDAPAAYQVWAFCKSHGIGYGGIYNPILILT